MEPQIPDIEANSAETIFEALRDRIPRYLPEWDDYNESDPGIALLQLFAVLGEGLAHQVERLPDRLRAELLALVNIRPQPALPAQAALTFTAKADRPPPYNVPLGSQVAAPGPDGQLIFETTAPMDLIAMPLTMVMAFDGARFTDLTGEHEAVDAEVCPFGQVPTVGAAFFIGFAPSRVAEWRVFPEEVRFELFKRPVFGGPPTGSGDQILVPPVRLVAEYRNDPARTGWRRLRIENDETAAFLRPGALRLEGPTDSVATVERPGDDPLHWIRLRIAGGAYAAGEAPKIDALWPNTVPARQETTERDAFIAEGTGLPDQEHRLKRTPVVIGSVELVDGESVTWNVVDTLAGADKQAPVFELDPGTGTLRFGDGVNGRIPGAGLALFARQYRHGGGTAGNVAAGQITALVSTLGGVAEVTNRLPATGAADAESDDELARAAPARLRGGGRLVTIADFAAEAARPPQVARAHALAAFHPNYPALETPGTVTLLILPKSNAMPPPAPDSELLRAIVDNMEPRRPIGVEILAIGPTYRTIAIDATIDVAPTASLATVQNAVTEALDAALSPLDWPFGLDLRPVSLLGAIQAVAGVLGVARFEVAVDGTPVENPAAAVRLARHEVVAPAPHTLFVRYAEDR